MSKIIKLDKLVKKITLLKKNKKTVVLCHGVFDLLHIGHIKHLQKAKRLGDILVVTITPDEYVKKGPNRPAFNSDLRMQGIASLKCVDFVSLNRWPSAEKTIKVLKPNIYCKGEDYIDTKKDLTNKIAEEIKAVKSVKGKIRYTTEPTYSSSNLLNKFFDIHTNEQNRTTNKIKKLFSIKDIINHINSFSKFRTLVIGESIIDEYNFCSPLGKSGKDPIIMLHDLYQEQYLGGTLAIARHVSEFCEKVSLVTSIGEKGEYKKFISKNLPKNVKPYFVKKSNSPTIVKKKYIDSINKNKVFGTYKINDDMLSKKDEKKFSSLINKLIKKHDLVILSDYGHGFISERMAKKICTLSKFIATNVQLNAANIGHHTINKYKNLDCLIINETELRHELRNKTENIENLTKKLCKKFKIKRTIVTRGSKGAIIYEEKKNKFYDSAAFAEKSLDKIGAGDAMMSIMALSLKQEKNSMLSLFLGSIAGAQSVEIMGNSDFVRKNKFLKTLEHLLK